MLLDYKGVIKYRNKLWWLYSFYVRILEWDTGETECKLLL
jgi:hypothetical protein